ncbi:MAG: transglutaminase-like cysteine peptidase [Tepidamorphaceae bacterium]|nr:transglutaminase-like cysteine peptidase [Rhodobiaceae bacterium]MCC0048885.1 transglutaminase-like cysteine peptidase [Rhodobiaceae bacterium]
MKATFIAMAALAAVSAASVPATAATPGQHTEAANMEVFGEARAPIGYVQFCGQFPNECTAAGRGRTYMGLTQARWAELDAINRQVNSTVTPVTDLELYGREELWTYPNRYGDCEDYALLKRHMLIRQGWAPESLLMTVVWDENGEGHAVLTVTTSAGDFVLDNKRDDIRRWQATGYTFEKRQSAFGRGRWVWLRGDRPSAMIGVGSTQAKK